jgi:hypothetical protein
VNSIIDLDRFRILVFFIPILLFQACAIDPPVQEFITKISLNKKFEIKTTKRTLVKQFNTNPVFFNVDKELRDSIFYFDISIPDKSATIGYKTSIFQKNSDTLILMLDSVINYRIYGKPFIGIDKRNINFYHTLKIENYIEFFDNAVINGLINSDDKAKNRVMINFMY